MSFFEYISEKENGFPNMLILNKKQYLEKWVKENNLDNNILFIINDKNYLNNEVSFEWLKYSD